MEAAKKSKNGRISRLKVAIRVLEGLLSNANIDFKKLKFAMTEVEKKSTLAEEAVDQLCDLVDDEEVILKISDEFDPLKWRSQELIDQANSLFPAEVTEDRQASPTPSNRSDRDRGYEAKLPTIHIDPFDGDFSKWMSFEDVFTALVHSRTNLTGAEKLQLLKNCLKGEAAATIQYISATNDNYEEAWNMLKTRYSSKKLIIEKLFSQLLHIKKIENSSGLHHLVNTVCGIQRTLSTLKLADTWDAFLCHFIKTRLDHTTVTSWEEKQSDEVPEYSSIIKFLEGKLKTNAATCDYVEKPAESGHSGKFKLTCPACKQSHKAMDCSAFRQASVNERWNLVKAARLCVNCFQANHSAFNCKSHGCRYCGQRHNSLLHNNVKRATNTEGEISKNVNKPSSSTTVATSTTINEDGPATLLGTANVYILDINGQPIKVRALLDQGAQSNLITKDCLQKLKIPEKRATYNVKGVGTSAAQAVTTKADLTIVNQQGDFNYKGCALVMDHIMNNQPQQRINGPLRIAKGIDLADQDFNTPGPIEALLGVDFYMKACRNGLKHSRGNGPGAQNTAFGWVLMGSLTPGMVTSSNSRKSTYINALTKEANDLWALKDVPKVVIRTKEDQLCDEHYVKNTYRQADGRYVVSLPLKKNPPNLAESRGQAVQRFLNTERKFRVNTQFATAYKNVIQEYIDLGHLKKVQEPAKTAVNYYIPHHAVTKMSSATTKTRVVFDASAKSTNGISLNDEMFTGPRLQDDLTDILIRFRTHYVAITADIEKMYRMIGLHESDQPLHRIIWRENENLPLEEYQLTRVTFGVKAAPYLAIRTMHQLAEDEFHRYPEAAKIITKDFYVDNLLSGADTLEEASDIVNKLNKLLQAGCFHLTQWASNQRPALKHVPENDKSIAPVQVSNEPPGINTLGLQWLPDSDKFVFSYEVPQHKKITKRTILSDIGKLFDPLGWLAPITIRGRIIFQNLWRQNMDWDTVVPNEFAHQWIKYNEDLKGINKILIERCIKGQEKGVFSLYGFCDSSESAYGACVYLRTKGENISEAHLIAAKCRVASLHATTLPRLELCGALELAQLLESVEAALGLNISEVHAFTDSTITLQWIKNLNVRWKPFVANRVAAIHEAVPHAKWHHIPGKDNVADCISRGISAEELSSYNEWWTGPKIIYQNEITEEKEILPNEEAKMEARSTAILATTVSPKDDNFINRFSDLNRLLRVTAWIMRFLKKLKKVEVEKCSYITATEMDNARKLWIMNAQQVPYANMIKSGSVPTNLQSLNPFVDGEKIVRVGGRLKNADISIDQKNPILLPKESRITRLLVENAHMETLHGGPQLMLNTLRQQYWIPNLKNIVKQVSRQCGRCARLRAKTCTQLMGDLPRDRVTAARPFQRVGIDYMGPFWMKTRTGRGAKRYKAYVAIFICFTTRAIHLECVGDLTTAAFLGSLRRFMARRGKPTDIYSDSGTNLVGGNNELKNYLKIARAEQRETEVGDQLSKLGINWHFSPPSAPHFGGLWEAGVKSTKYHLKRIIGDTALTTEEMDTVLCQVEAVLNSRPLVDISDDPQDLNALTPGHFLIGGPLIAHPEPNFREYKESQLTRWTRLQQMIQHFWRRWHSEYLTRLQQRPKWAKATKDLQVDELVLIKEENIPPLHWQLARIQEVHTGADGHVRVVTVRTAKGTYKRPITKICRLPINRDTASEEE